MGVRSHRSGHGTDPHDQYRKQSDTVHVEHTVGNPGFTLRLTNDPATD